MSKLRLRFSFKEKSGYSFEDQTLSSFESEIDTQKIIVDSDSESGHLKQKPQPEWRITIYEDDVTLSNRRLFEEQELHTTSKEYLPSDLFFSSLLRKHFFDEYSSRLIKLIKEQDFEYGIDTTADKFVRELMLENDLITREWLNHLFIKHYDNTAITIGILRIISHFDYSDMYPQGPTMALAALSNVNAEIKECGIRAFENWGSLDSLDVLKNTHCSQAWLQEYLDQVISDIEEEILEDVPSS